MKRKWRLLLVTGVIVLIAVAVLLMMTPYFVWNGDVNRPLRVRVFGERTEHPISNATVKIFDSHWSDMIALAEGADRDVFIQAMKEARLIGDTDDHGTVLLRVTCGAGGSSGWFGRTGRFGVSQIIEIEHPEYDGIRIKLSSLLGADHFSLSMKELEAKVWLIRKSDNSPSHSR